MLQYQLIDIAFLNTDADENGEEENNEIVATELRFVPEDENQLDAMYRAMAFCQSLHPDPNDSFSECKLYWNVSRIRDSSIGFNAGSKDVT